LFGKSWGGKWEKGSIGTGLLKKEQRITREKKPAGKKTKRTHLGKCDPLRGRKTKGKSNF